MKKLLRKKFQSGFTLIEILVVIGIIAVLATIVIAAINPAKQFAQARDTQRQSNVEAILNAIGQRMADNEGIFAGQLGSVTCASLPTDTNGGKIYNQATSDPNGIDLSCLVPTYIAILPSDPTSGNGTDTGYTVYADTAGRVHVCAPAATLETAIPGAPSVCVVR